jgi:hypothetical protein
VLLLITLLEFLPLETIGLQDVSMLFFSLKAMENEVCVCNSWKCACVSSYNVFYHCKANR